MIFPVRLLIEYELPISFHTWYEIFPEAEQTVGTAFTVTIQVPDLLLPSVEVAVMVAVPAAIPVTSPLLFTVAIVGSLVVQLSTGLAALAGRTVAGINIVEPTFTVEVCGKVTELTSTGGIYDPKGDRTDPGITSDGTVPV